MLNFEVINPVRIVFGKEQLDRLPALLTDLKASNVMIVYGGGSAKRIGLLEKIKSQLSTFNVIEFGGVEANPEFSTLMNGVKVARANEVDFILALGGGSVIDGVKFMSGAILYQGDAWDVLAKKEGCDFTEAIPFGTILTLPATGSEANSGAVISRTELKEKRVMGGPLFFPKFSFCDPTVVATLPKRQLINGVIDSFVHTLEQYITYPTDNLLQEREAEAVLSTLIEIKEVVDKPEDYKLASNLMWCATHALNGNLRCGVPTDWATHMIGHELTALYHIDHAQTLAIVLPRLYEHQFESKKEKLAQYGARVWGLTGSVDTVAKEAIQLTESFFNELGVPTKLSEHTDNYQKAGDIIAGVFEERNWNEMGERGAIGPKEVSEIVIATY